MTSPSRYGYKTGLQRSNSINDDNDRLIDRWGLNCIYKLFRLISLILNQSEITGNVVTALTVCWAAFVANLPLSLSPPVKEFWKSANIWASYGRDFSVLLFLTLGVDTCMPIRDANGVNNLKLLTVNFPDAVTLGTEAELFQYRFARRTTVFVAREHDCSSSGGVGYSCWKQRSHQHNISCYSRLLLFQVSRIQ